MKTPPLLLGVTLLFWGWQTELLLFAALMAAVIEGARLAPFRWDFTRADFSRIADGCTVILLGMLFYLLISQSLVDIIFMLMQWLPFAFFPLLAGQCYSMNDRIDLRSLFLTLRRKQESIQTPPITLNLTYPYVILCLLSAGAANVRTLWFYLGLCILSAWALWALRSKRYSVMVWTGLLLAAALIGYGGQNELAQLQRALEQNATLLRWFTGFQGETDPYQSVTAIGDIGTVKLSNRVMFRVKSESGPQPALLLRETTYDKYASSKWYAIRSEFVTLQPEQDGLTWKHLAGNADNLPVKPTPGPSQETGLSNSRSWSPLSEVASMSGSVNAPRGGHLSGGFHEKLNRAASQEGPVKRITVSLSLPNGMGMLKLPTGTFQIDKLPVGILAANQFGALKVAEGPEIVTYQALFRSYGTLDNPPNERDRFIPPDELPAIRKLAEELALAATAPNDSLQKIAIFFQEHFTYSLTLSRQTQQLTPLADFLSNSRTGHCEYFATAAVLLLRAAGIPARYAVGYAVERLDQEGTWTLVRGRDAHAWTLVYLNGAWQDFDPTPAVWRQIEEQSASPFEFISTRWSQWMFAFAEWRTHERGLGKYLGWFLIPLLLALAWKLRSKQRIKSVKKSAEPHIAINAKPGSDSTFYLIEQHLQAAGLVRNPWEPLAQWLQRLTEHAAPTLQALPPMLRLHYRYRFDPAGLSPAEKAALKEQVQAWLAQSETKPAGSQETH